jgi:hypothetical protein
MAKTRKKAAKKAAKKSPGRSTLGSSKASKKRGKKAGKKTAKKTAKRRLVGGMEAALMGYRRQRDRYSANSKGILCVEDDLGGCMNEPEITSEMALTAAEAAMLTDPKQIATRFGEGLWLEKGRQAAQTRRGKAPLRSSPIAVGASGGTSSRTIKGAQSRAAVAAMVARIARTGKA